MKIITKKKKHSDYRLLFMLNLKINLFIKNK